MYIYIAVKCLYITMKQYTYCEKRFVKVDIFLDLMPPLTHCTSHTLIGENNSYYLVKILNCQNHWASFIYTHVMSKA